MQHSDNARPATVLHMWILIAKGSNYNIYEQIMRRINDMHIFVIDDRAESCIELAVVATIKLYISDRHRYESLY